MPSTKPNCSFSIAALSTLFISQSALSQSTQSDNFQFHLEEATISDVHRAIQEEQLTCVGLVQMYLDRAQAYNGVSNQLVTRDGAPVPSSPGVVRAGSPLEYPT